MEFPYELEYEIVQFAVRNHPTTAPALQLVAHRVKQWVDSILHEYVVLDDCKNEGTTAQVRKLGQVYASTLTAETAKYTSSLCLTYHHKLRDEELSNMALCKRVYRLACWVEQSRYPTITSTIAQMPLQMLSIELTHFMTLPKTSAFWLSRLTHLELIFWTHEEPPKLEPLDFLPSVTHVCLNWGSPDFPTSVETVLETCSTLKTLIITRMSGTWDRLQEFQSRRDAEHVDIIVMSTLKGLQDWKPGGQSIWEHAEEVIAAKNRSATGQKVIDATAC
ncbi:hypothetical protein D9758_002965 [Tetrapyrgos nigripes]|uniref:Uncharacterized protein n=1 Tax=Tetrapyrgos nigripes TaxID=182062 RepID=A0A8H5GPH3_9AGAR|nr:hypothetical protein D9758_002965 [Tetrapyrgos nigripes]